MVEMSSEALIILKAKIRQIDNALSDQATISQSITSIGDKTDPKIAQLIDYSQSELIRICRPVPEVVETDINFSTMSSMLLEMDAVCGASLRTFQSLLPEVQTRTCAQRRIILLDILVRYSCLYLTDEPSVVTTSNHKNSENENGKNNDGKRNTKSDENNHKASDEDRNRHKGDGDGDKSKSNTAIKQETKPEREGAGEGWLKYTTWYSQRKESMQDIERDFSSFVEDEREKEGRLLKKWLSLSDPSESSSSSFSSSSSSSLSSSSTTATATTASAASSSPPASLNTSSNNSSGSSSNSFSNNNAPRPRRSSAVINGTSFPSPITPITAHTETVTVTPNSNTEKYQDVVWKNSNRVRASSDSVIDASRTREVLTHLKQRVESNVFEGTYVTCTAPEYDKVKRSNIIPSKGSSLRQKAVQRLTSDTVPYSTTLASQLHSPRCMTAFIEYFCSYYIATPYGLYGMKGGEELLEALKVILEVLWTVDSIRCVVEVYIVNSYCILCILSVCVCVCVCVSVCVSVCVWYVCVCVNVCVCCTYVCVCMYV